MAVILLKMGCSRSYTKPKWFSSSQSRTTSSARALPPSPPLAHTSERATFTPSSLHFAATRSSSAWVSVGKALMATTQGTP